MSFEEIHLTHALDDKEVDLLKGARLDDKHYDVLLGGKNVKVYTPSGDLLLCLVKNAVPLTVAQSSLPFLRRCDEPITNRGTAAGVQLVDGVQYLGVTTKGHVTNTYRIPDKVARALGSSATVGYFDRYARFPYCRACRYTLESPAEWREFVKLVKVADSVFKAHHPSRYEAQKALAELTDPAWVIADTAFTTVTINRNFATAVHKDAGDLEEGFGVLAFFQTGIVQGGILVIPKYKIAVRLESCDILLFDVHEWHGNTELVGDKSKYNRYTCVFYYREKMCRCGSPQYELERSKHCRDLKRLYDPGEIEKGDGLKRKAFSKRVVCDS